MAGCGDTQWQEWSRQSRILDPAAGAGSDPSREMLSCPCLPLQQACSSPPPEYVLYALYQGFGSCFPPSIPVPMCLAALDARPPLFFSVPF